MKRDLWKEPLSKTYVPSWHCPSCDRGYLRLKPDSLHFTETSGSRNARDLLAWEPEWIKYRFSAVLICNNGNCQEPVSVAGRGRVKGVQTSEDGDYEYVDFFYPEYVSPSPPIIPVPEASPESVADELHKAFIASWGDYPAAANHVRSAVERLLDFLKEPKTRLNAKGKREQLKLHDRIIGLASRDKDLSDSLLAVKWLGNIGSHSDEISRDDVFDAFDILELIFDDLFVKHRERVKKLITAINIKKGPAKKSTRRGPRKRRTQRPLF